MNCFMFDNAKQTIPIHIIPLEAYPTWLDQQATSAKTWLQASAFKNTPRQWCLLPDAKANIEKVIVTVSDKNNWWEVAGLAMQLPQGIYYFAVEEALLANYALAWGLGSYQFTKYKKPPQRSAQLSISKTPTLTLMQEMLQAIFLVRDLINTPTEDMGPSQLSHAACALAKEFKAQYKEIVGEDLLKENYPAIHTVGRASTNAPRLIDLRWGNAKHPKVTLVGKGVCFDSGGLDIKPSAAMLLMKKDMAGAAHVLGLARMIMAAQLPICLRVLIPAVENVISGNAYKPGDIIKSRAGLTIEIGNTDAEGRVVLADALAEAVTEKPDLIIDIATLTGAARIALGTDLPALFSNDDALTDKLLHFSQQTLDPMWRMPLYMPYKEYLNSVFADLNNSSQEPYAGAITAALFLKEFVPDTISWVHFDLMAWNLRARPGRPLGGEAMAIRSLFAYLQATYNLL